MRIDHYDLFWDNWKKWNIFYRLSSNENNKHFAYKIMNQVPVKNERYKMWIQFKDRRELLLFFSYEYLFSIRVLSWFVFFSLFVVCYHSKVAVAVKWLVCVVTKSSFKFYFYFEVRSEINEKMCTLWYALCNTTHWLVTGHLQSLHINSFISATKNSCY